jgi:hypothetical protein
MASGAFSMTELTFKSASLMRSNMTVLLRIVRGLGEVMSVRGEDTIIPNARGRTPRNRMRDRLAIELRGMVMGTGSDEAAQRASFVDLRQELRELFNPDDPPGQLVVTLEDGTTQSIDARAVNLLWGDDDIPTYRTLSVELEAVEDWSTAGS